MEEHGEFMVGNNAVKMSILPEFIDNTVKIPARCLKI